MAWLYRQPVTASEALTEPSPAANMRPSIERLYFSDTKDGGTLTDTHERDTHERDTHDRGTHERDTHEKNTHEREHERSEAQQLPCSVAAPTEPSSPHTMIPREPLSTTGKHEPTSADAR